MQSEWLASIPNAIKFSPFIAPIMATPPLLFQQRVIQEDGQMNLAMAMSTSLVHIFIEVLSGQRAKRKNAREHLSIWRALLNLKDQRQLQLS